MKGKFYIFAIVTSFLSLFSLFAGLACEDDDDDDSTNNDDDNDSNIDDDVEGDDDANSPLNPECDDTASPLLLGVHLYVNDVEVTMPATVKTTDSLKVGMEYSDSDCNLAGGYITIQIHPNEPDFHNLENAISITHLSITNSIGCSSEEEGEQYFVELDPAYFLVPENLTKTLPFIFALYDKCSFCSVPLYLPLDFTVIEN